MQLILDQVRVSREVESTVIENPFSDEFAVVVIVRERWALLTLFGILLVEITDVDVAMF